MPVGAARVVLFGSIDASARLWAATVATNGGSVSRARLKIVSKFITKEKAAGNWALTDDYWPLWGEDAPGALTSLKQLRLATVTAAPTFTVDRGYAFDGATNYIDTGFIPSSMAVAMTGSNMRIAVYERTNITTTSVAAGTNDSTTKNLFIRPRTGASATTGGLDADGTAVYASSVTDSRGLTAISRTAATVFEGYKNGVSTGTVVPASNATVLPTRTTLLGVLNNVGTPASFRACSLGFVSVGASLTAAQELAAYSNVQAWATAIGANV